MGNMSYCRFENTAKDLSDCLEATYNEELSGLSETEINGFLDLVKKCKTIAKLYEDYTKGELMDMINEFNDIY